MKHLVTLKAALRHTILTVLFMAVGTIANAQTGTAFYIYQNDSHFDGFFYDQVKSMSYSKIDTLGREHDIYVTQEIVTNDSTYHIMLTSIDSVSFIQPDVRYNPKLVRMDDNGMVDYVCEGSGMTLKFYNTMPEGMRPHVGDVLASFTLPQFEDGFVGKVKLIYDFQDMIVVQCEKIRSLSEVFDQFVGVEEILVDKQGNARRRCSATPRRKDGMRYLDGSADLELFKLDIALQDAYKLNDTWTASLDLKGGFAMGINIVYNINGLGDFYIKAETKESIELGGGVNLSGQFASKDNVLEEFALGQVLKKFAKIPIPATMPLLNLKPAPIPFFRGEANFAVGLNVGLQGKMLDQYFILQSKKPYLGMGMTIKDKFSGEGSIGLTAELNGFVQAGVKFPMKLATADWCSYVLEGEMGTTIWAGPKLSANATLDILGAYKGGVYEGFKSSKLQLSAFAVDAELSAKMQGFFGKPQEKKFTYSRSYGNYTMTLFPDVSDLEYEITGDAQNEIEATVKTSGAVFAPQRIGVGLYNEINKSLVSAEYNTEVYSLTNVFGKTNVKFTNVQPGKYILRPLINFMGMEVPVYSEEKKIEVGEITLSLSPQTLNFDKEPATLKSYVTTLSTDLTAHADKLWINPRIVTENNAPVVYVDVEANNTDAYREGFVEVKAVYNSGKVYKDTIRVCQFAGISLTTSEVEFDLEGGMKILDVKTNLSNINVSVDAKTSEWITAAINGTALTVTAKANTGKSREGVITLAAPEGSNIVTAALKVKQISPFNLKSDTVLLSSQSWEESELSYEGDLTDINLSYTESWMNAYADAENHKITVYSWKENKSKSERKATVRVTGKVGEQQINTSFLVIQSRADYISTWMYVPDTFELEGSGKKVIVGTQSSSPYVKVRGKRNAGWISYSYDAGDDELSLWATRNTSDEERIGIVEVVADNGETGADYDESVYEMVVKQPPYENTMPIYEGFIFGLRYNGDGMDEIMGRNNTHSSWYPSFYPNVGVYGFGQHSENMSRMSSRGSEGGQSWDAEITVIEDSVRLIYGSVTYVTKSESYNFKSTRTISFSINGMRCNNIAVRRTVGTAMDVNWYGDGSYCWLNREKAPWISQEDLWAPYTISGYRHVAVTERTDDETGEVTVTTSDYSYDPVQLNFALYRKNSSSTKPHGTPEDLQ